MVLVQSAPQSPFSRIQPNPTRIAGIACALALNAAVLLLLMQPLELKLPPMARPMTVVDIPLPQAKLKPPPPVVDVEREKPKPTSEARVPVQKPVPQAPAVDVPVVFDAPGPLDLPVPEVAGPPADPVPQMAAGPVSGVRLEYASAPAPAYPRRALTDRVEGQVLLQVLVDIDGRPLRVDVHRSSGNRELDRTAQQQVLRHWTFRPAMRDGQAIQAIGIVPIDFKLQ